MSAFFLFPFSYPSPKGLKLLHDTLQSKGAFFPNANQHKSLRLLQKWLALVTVLVSFGHFFSPPGNLCQLSFGACHFLFFALKQDDNFILVGGNVIEKEMVAECKPLLHCHLPIKFNELNEYTNLNNLATIKVINMYYMKIL